MAFIKDQASVIVANKGNCNFFIKNYNNEAEFQADYKEFGHTFKNCFRTKGVFKNMKELDLYRDCLKEMCGQSVDRVIADEEAEWAMLLKLDYEQEVR